MRVDAVNFGNNQRIPSNHEEMQKKAYAQIMKHYQETGKYEPAIIDYYQNGEPKITYLSDKKSGLSGFFSSIKKVLKRIIKK